MKRIVNKIRAISASLMGSLIYFLALVLFSTINAPAFAQAVQDWIAAVGAKTAYIEPGSPWENGYCEKLQLPLQGRIAER